MIPDNSRWFQIILENSTDKKFLKILHNSIRKKMENTKFKFKNIKRRTIYIILINKLLLYLMKKSKKYIIRLYQYLIIILKFLKTKLLIN